MFGIGLPEMILILALALIVVGPDKLPELARSVAKGVLELKDLTEDNPFDAIKPELEEAAESIKKQIGEATPDGFTGIVKDLEKGIQEVIDTDGTVIPVDTAEQEKNVEKEKTDGSISDDEDVIAISENATESSDQESSSTVDDTTPTPNPG